MEQRASALQQRLEARRNMFLKAEANANGGGVAGSGANPGYVSKPGKPRFDISPALSLSIGKRVSNST